MRFGSLFSGIGGLDLGLERAGMTCVWQSEIQPYACRVLAKHWPNIPNLGDIRDIDWRTVDSVDLVAGGYPCQPFSLAGVRRGQDDPRHLWPMFAECIRVVRPRYALLENVTGHLSLGFGSVLADLAAIGYDAQWDCVPAATVGAPHLRDRVFVIATRRETMADAASERQQTAGGSSLRIKPATDVGRHCGGASPGRHRWQAQPDLGRVADGIPNRLDRLRGLGNAVVPQVAEHLGRIIMEAAL